MPSRNQEAPAPDAASALPFGRLDAAAGPRPERRYLRKFLSYYRPHLPLLAADLACAVLAAATALALPLCAHFVTRRLTELQGAPGALTEVGVVGVIMLTLVAVQALATLFVDYQGHVMGAKMEGALRQELFDHCQALSFSFHDRQRVGQLMSRITGDLMQLSELYHHGPEDLAIGVLKLVGATTILAVIDLPLALVVIGMLPFALIYALHFNGRMGAALRLGKAQLAAVNERVEDSLAGVRVVQSFANEALETGRFRAENQRFLDARRVGYRSEAHFSAGMGAFAQLLTVAVIVAGAVRIVQAQLGVAEMLTFLLCVAVLIDPIQRLTNFVRLWQSGYTGFQRFMEILETAPDIQDRPAAVQLTRVRGEIVMRGVGFRYAQDRSPVLKDLDLSIRPGEFVALVGASGAGKSTLCALIPRFYDATTGQVTIDGLDVRDVAAASLRRNIGVVQQEVYLFAGSVADNLRYGRPDATWAEVEAAARAAHAHDFIVGLPDGYDTDIGQRGVKLSGGQKQRLTIARTFLKDPPVLVFDEATSALDNESERAIQQALATLAEGRTTLVIAHRLSTIRHAHRILVLADGAIVEEGPHEVLIAAGGAYARLYSMHASL